MRHMVADTIRAPSECEFAQIARPDHDSAVMVSQSEQMAGALTRLHIFESDVVNLTAVTVRMADLLERQARAWPDVEFMPLAADRLHQMLGLLQRARAGREAGHRVREHVFARIAEPVHRLHAPQQRLRRINTA